MFALRVLASPSALASLSAAGIRLSARSAPLLAAASSRHARVFMRSYATEEENKNQTPEIPLKKKKKKEDGPLTSIKILSMMLTPNIKDEEVMRLLEVAKQNRCADVYLWNTVLSHFFIAGNHPEVRKLLDRMRTVEGIKPNTTTYNILLHAYCKADLLDKAHEMVKEMVEHDCKPNIPTYAFLIEYNAKKGNEEKVNELLKEMQEVHNVKPDDLIWRRVNMLPSKRAELEAKALAEGRPLEQPQPVGRRARRLAAQQAAQQQQQQAAQAAAAAAAAHSQSR